MSSSTKLLAIGGAGVVILLLLSKSGAVSIPGITPAPVNTTAANVTAATTGIASLANAFKNLFSGPTTAPLTSGASPSNPNDTTASSLASAGAGNTNATETGGTFDYLNPYSDLTD